jgi:hypothetical protein
MDQKYIKNYALENLFELFGREDLNRYDNLFNNGEDYELKFGSR